MESLDYGEACKAVLADDEWIGELEKKTKSGESRIVDCRWTLVREANGQPSAILTIDTDITARKKADVDYSDEQQWEICHVFTCEPKQLRKTFRDSGIEEIKNQSELILLL